MNAVKRTFKDNIKELAIIIGGIALMLLVIEFLLLGTNRLLGIKYFEFSIEFLDIMMPIMLFIFFPFMNFVLLTNKFRDKLKMSITRRTFWKSVLLQNIFQVIFFVSLRLVLDYLISDYLNIDTSVLTGNFLNKSLIYLIIFGSIITLTNTIWLLLSKFNFMIPHILITRTGGLTGFLIYIITYILFSQLNWGLVIDVLNELLNNMIYLPTVIGAILIGILSYVNYKLILQIDAR